MLRAFRALFELPPLLRVQRRQSGIPEGGSSHGIPEGGSPSRIPEGGSPLRCGDAVAPREAVASHGVVRERAAALLREVEAAGGGDCSGGGGVGGGKGMPRLTEMLLFVRDHSRSRGLCMPRGGRAHEAD